MFGLVGGLVGLFITYVALNAMNGSGQPALLYIVPCTLGISVYQATFKSIFSFIFDFDMSFESVFIRG